MKQLILVGAALVTGVVILMGLVATRPTPPKVEPPPQVAVVETTRVAAVSRPVRVQAQGTVVAAEQVELQSEVSGRVVWMSANLVPGGRFKKGEALVKVDPRDYEVAVQQQKAEVNRAALDLELERGRKVVAEREWQVLSGTGDQQALDPEGQALVLREPQLKDAQVRLEATNAALRRATLNLERTIIRAPFNGFVQSESVDMGQLLSPGVRLGTLVGTDTFWVQVAVSTDDLAWIHLPENDKAGSRARVMQEAAYGSLEREGEVIRLLGDVDPVGRMARVLVAIDNPLASSSENAPPLLVGSYVRVELLGKDVQGLVEIPRTALRDGNTAYVVENDTLVIREVEIAFRTPTTVLLRKGVGAGEEVITSRVPLAIPGIPVVRANEVPTEVKGARAVAVSPASGGTAGEAEVVP